MNTIVQEVQNKYSFLDNLLTNFWKSWIKSDLTFKLQIHNIQWKNSKALPGCAYRPTQIEQVANVITHGIPVLPALIAVLKLFERSKTASQFLVSWVYGSALIMLFTVSTFFHSSLYCAHQNGLKNLLHRLDRAMIYIFIAGSYFPWLQLNSANSSLLFCLEWLIWLLAAIGIAYQQLFHERFKCLETFFYFLMGFFPALLVVVSGHEFHGMTELKLGGLFYIIGICFFKSDGLIPMAHAIWHIFVVIAAGLHYYAILINLYPTDSI